MSFATARDCGGRETNRGLFNMGRMVDKVPTETEVRDVIQRLNRQSTVVLLARLATHLFLDQFHGNASETIYLQGFLISTFMDDEVLDRAKQRMPNAQLDFRRAFHLQQILTVLKWTILNALPSGGIEPDKDKDARFALGRCLLKTSDLLFPMRMKEQIARDRKSPSAKNYLRLQLAVGAGNEINNPPPVVNAAVRSATIFEEILKRTPSSIDLSSQLKRQAGISLDSYVDLIFGALAIYLCRSPKELIENAGLAVLNPKTFFGSSVPSEMTEQFWQMESCTMSELANMLSGKVNSHLTRTSPRFA